MTDHRPLGTGPATAETSRTQDTDPPATRAPLAAERLPAAPAATDHKPRPSGRRALGFGPASPGQ
ncbi:hypothetical protein AQJ11_32825 [Streptomyces corchorusii]|uniref:Uncharacterized protein n=2 Tax=Streptomyces TaxID=1883 RepID=A0A101PW27_STRCK|nr:hypothetical protein [Streptomyces corchorusii]KUN18752.1 hypothetical protein AQJ11_32825 [Streptomyces corchorusii]